MRAMVIGMGLKWHAGAIRLPEQRSQWPTPGYLHYHRAAFEERVP